MLNVGEVGAASLLLVMLLVHSNLVQLVIVQLVDLHFLNLAVRVHGRRAHTSIDAVLVGHSLAAGKLVTSVRH